MGLSCKIDIFEKGTSMRKLFIAIASFHLCTAFAEQSKIALITGASKGVGFETAELLAKNGFTVYGTIRNAPPETTQNIHFLQVDLLNDNSIEKAVQAILKKEGHIDILVNNAGYGLAGPIESLTEEEMHEQLEVNFFAPIRFIQAVLPEMRNQKSGHIINISSVNAFSTAPFGGIYAASKAALESLSESLCIEVQPYNISVSIIEPGLIQTHFSIPMGTKKILNNPYQAITDKIDAEIQERLANPKLLSPSQTSQEIAEFLFSVIQDPHPKLRYQTSTEAKNLVSKKLLDLTGDIFLDEMRDFSETTKKKETIGNQETLQDFSPQAKSIQSGSIYEHYKGMLYKILGVARHSETLEEMVTYQALYGEGDIWVRPINMFLEDVVINGELTPRFTKKES